MPLRDAGDRDLLDPAELTFRKDSVPAGGWVTFIAVGTGAVYVAAWADQHRLAMMLLLAVGAAGGVVVLRLPWDRILRSPLREPAFIAWSLLDVALIIALAGIDGGGDSPLALLLFIPIVFAGMSYPRDSVMFVGGAVLGSYAGLALASHVDAGLIAMYTGSLACTALMSVWQARNHERRRELLLIASQTDPLTNALNRRGFQQAASTLLAGVARFGHPATLVLLDLDRFKHYNDAHGHAAGDELLCWVVHRIRGALRPTDSVARLGGDEFALLLAGADRAAGEIAVRRVSEDLAERVRISCGMASAPAEGEHLDALYRRADSELYDTKRARVRDPDPDPEATTA
jgi:diguanylate cyclase (GGDEF)-like protein